MIDAHLNCRKADARQDAKPTLKRSPGKTKRKSTFAKVDRSLVGCRALNLMCVCVLSKGVLFLRVVLRISGEDCSNIGSL